MRTQPSIVTKHEQRRMALSRLISCAGLVLFLAGANPSALAQTSVLWTSTSNGNWTTTGNWSGGTVPANDLTTHYGYFNNATGVTVTFDSNRSVGGVEFGPSAGAYTISRTGGGTRTMTLGAYGVRNYSSANQVIQGSGMILTLGAASSFLVEGSGNLTINTTGGSIGTTGTNTLTLGGDGSGTGTVSSVIAGTGGIVKKEGSGTWVLSAANTFTGGVEVYSGTLRVGGSSTGVLGTGASTLTLAGGTLQLAHTANRAFSRNTTVSGNATIVADRGTASATNITYTLGTLSIGGNNTLTISRGSNVTGAGVGAVTFGATSLTGDATVSVGSSATLTLGALNDSGTGRSFTKTGAGTLTLGTAATSLANGTAINVEGGVLNANNATALGSLAAVTLSTGALINLGAAQTWGSLGGTGGTVALGANTLTLGNAANNLSDSYGGIITGTGALIKSGTGTQTLSGASTYTGTTTISQGTLQVDANAPSGSAGALGNAASAVVLNNAGTGANDTGLLIGASGVTIGRSINVTNNGTGTTRLGGNFASGTATFSGAVALNKNATFVADGTSAVTFSGVISGTGVLTKTGSGTVILSAANTRTGNTVLGEGTLRAITNAGAIGTGASALTLSGGTLELAHTAGLNFARNTTINGNTTIVSDRTTASATNITHTLGTLSIDTNTLSIARGSNVTGSALGAITFGATTLTGNSTFDVGANSLLTLGALNDGTVGRTLTKTGTGTLTLGTAATSLVNGTTVNVQGGTLNANNATALGTLAAVNLSSGATVNLGAAQTWGSLGGSGGTVALGANTLTVGSTNNLSSTYGGTITGTGALIKAGTGTLTLNASSSYTGNTTVNAGTLNIQHGSALGSGTGNITVATGSTLQLQGGITVNSRPLALNGGTLESVSGANMWNGNVTVGTGGGSILSSTAGQLLTIGPGDWTGTIGMGSNTLTVGGAGNVLINSFVGNLGDTGGLIKVGSGTVTFYGDANYYTGTTDVRDGTLVLDTANFPFIDETIRGNLIIGDGIGAANSAIVRYGSGLANNKIANTSAITVNSDGLLDLNNRDDTVGAITLQGGRVVTGTGVLTLNGNITTLASSQTAEITGVLSLDSATRTFTVADGAAASDLTIGAKINFGSIIKAGDGTMTITSDNTIGYGGTTAVNAGVLNIRHSNALGQAAGGSPSAGTSVASGAALEVQNSISVASEHLTLNGTGISGGGALRSVSGTNTWGGPISLANTARINTDADTLTINGTITALNQNLLVGGAGTTVINGAIGTGSGTLTKDGSGTVILAGNNTYSGATTVESGVLNVRHSNALGSTLAGTTVQSGAELQLQKVSSDLSIGNESLSLSGTGVSGGGALRNISGNNTWAGAITVSSATARINSDADTLTLSNTVALGTNTLAVGGAGNTTITGQLTGASSSTLTKDGAGTLTLSNSTNTFSGDVNVTAGTLAFGASNSLNNTAIDLSVSAGASVNLVQYAQSIGTLAGLGAVDFGTGGTLTLDGGLSFFSGSFSGTGEIIVSAGSTLRLGADFNAAGLTITLAGGTLEVNGSNSVFGALNITGDSVIDFSASLNSTVLFTDLNLNSFTLAVSGWADTQDYFLVTNQPGTRGEAPLNQVTFGPSGGPPWNGGHTTWQPWDKQVTPVPEPSTYGAMLMGAGLAFFGYRRWRRQRAAKA